MNSRLIAKLTTRAAVAVALMTAQVQAVQITGGISFGGDYLPVNAANAVVSDLTLATALKFGPDAGAGIGSTFVVSTSGDFASVPSGSVATIASPIAVNPAGALPAGAVWSVGGFSLTLSSISELAVSPGNLTLSGSGTLNGAGFTPTQGSWIATLNTIVGTYSWSFSSSAVPVPHTVSGVIACPNGNSAAGIVVSVGGVGSTTTAGNGAYSLDLPDVGTFTICVDLSTLPAGASLVGTNCTTFTIDNSANMFANVDFTLTGAFCENTPPPGPCWLTGGGTVDKTKGQPDYSFGGVVNPGCSPTAAGGGNWNVVDHLHNLHFKGLDITVTGCSGVPTKSPKVTLNIIDFVGTGTIQGISGNPAPKIPVSFTARAIDNSESGGGKDQLYLNVVDITTGHTVLLISTDASHPTNTAPKTITTGNLQIHQTGCN
jgi:hypothetical protein